MANLFARAATIAHALAAGRERINSSIDPRGADAAGGDAGLLSKLSEFGGDIPVVDVVAGVAGTGLGAYGDIKSGQPWYEAVPEDAASNAGGLAAGALAGGAVAGAAVFAGAPLLAGVAGVAVGTVVAYGVGDLAHNLFHESWGADVHDHGVAGGVLYGIGHSEVKTATDAGHLAAHGRVARGNLTPGLPQNPCVTVSRYTALAVLVIRCPVSSRPSVRSSAAVWRPLRPASWWLSSRCCASRTSS
jgi:hypothetical protein